MNEMSRANYLSSASSLIRGVVKMNIIETLQKYDYQSVVIIDDKIGITDPLVTIDQLREIDGKNNISDAQLARCGSPSTRTPIRDLNNVELNELIANVFVNEQYISSFVNDIRGYTGLIKKVNLEDDSDVKNLQTNVLWIIDRKLENEHEEHIKKVISLYTSRIREGRQDVLIFYTNHLDDIKTYEGMKHFIKRKLGSDVSNEIMYINALSKDQPINASFIEKAIQKISKVLIFEMFSKNSDNTIEKIRQRLYDKPYYEYLIDYDYLAEGKNAFKAFSHVLFSTHSKEFYSLDDDKKQRIERTNEISNKKFQDCEPYQIFRTKLIARIIKTYHQLYNPSDIQKYLDNENDDIGVGDIFKIGTDHYLLIHHECNLIIREDGERASDQLKLVKLKYEEKTDVNDRLKYEISKVINNEIQGFDTNYPGKDKKTIVQEAVDVIKQIDSTFPFTKDQLFNGRNANEGDLVTNNGKLFIVNIDSMQTVFRDSWLLDCSIYSRKNNESFILWDFLESNRKISTLRKIEYLKTTKKHEIEAETATQNSDTKQYLQIKEALEINIDDSGHLLIPIQRIGKLPHELVAKYTDKINQNENRPANQDSVAIT
jgi:hypothetical protein